MSQLNSAMDTSIPNSSGGLDTLGANALEIADDPDLSRVNSLFVDLLKDIKRGCQAKHNGEDPRTYIELVEAILAAHDGKFDPDNHINKAHHNGGSTWLMFFVGGEVRKRLINSELLTHDIAEFLEYHARNEDALKRHRRRQGGDPNSRSDAPLRPESLVGSNSRASAASAGNDDAQPTPRVDHNDVRRGVGSGNMFYGRVRDIVINNGQHYHRDNPQ
ncbi:hypothetical protein GRF29_8g111382 [Pseudopithomyces chartarum]|uniref:Uncharacterized protein n=1 Tax=Pseudopithomyces chartarum TaxID=1892770 RepID=A0AAN6RK53_9PLEO|nr:hypothetical protein GRF29_8g111382 [Pseudopithomyces chartarum]